MTHDTLILVAAGALFVAFLLGGLAGWLVLRAASPAPVAAGPTPSDTAEAAQARERAAALEAELHEARIEIEELRDYIDRRRAREG
ncbi:hypothetical protein [Paracoccus sanguinis]|uniref:hypothetical protein n=1 Tax=Paracoccus sanguinis TaxID=1545044 RepID=UPI001452123C|nr:hypothetical protein [Paracoccus sanguinis]QJD16952.1 hypothetical protein HGN31_08785 [Paracoccus sanguinis]